MTCLAEHGQSGYRIPRRVAILRCPVELIEELLSPGKILDCIVDKIGPVDYSWLHTAIKFPGNCRIEAVSTALFFFEREVAIRIECEDFRETSEGCIIPMVNAIFDQEGFYHWSGSGVRGDYRYRLRWQAEAAEQPKVKFREFI